MTRVIYYVAASLDGYIANTDGGVGWLAPFEGSDEDYGYSQFYASIDAVLLGRRTYDQARAFPEWPYSGKSCWVFSRGGCTVSEPGVTATGDAPRRVLDELQARNLRRAWLVGGGELAGVFQREGLISEYVVSVVPVLLGAGIPLLQSPGSMTALQLTKTTPYPSGIVQLTYAPVTDA